MQIGYDGNGNMGGILALRLQLSLPLVDYDPSYSAMRCVAENSARLASGLRELAAEDDMIFLSLPTSQRASEVFFGANSLYQDLTPCTQSLDQTVSDPNETRAA